MNNLERLELIDRIARELQARMSYGDIDAYLTSHGVDTKQQTSGVNSKWVYSKELLAGEPAAKILRLASELQVPHNFVVAPGETTTESTFWAPGYFRLFLSHLAVFKQRTAQLQRALRSYGISGFVAHVDIQPTREWRREIEVALLSMDAMAVILMPGFKDSNWTDQEVGFAIGRDRLVIPVIRGLDPYGFLGKYQGLMADGKTVGQVAHGLFAILGTNERTRGRLVGCLGGLLTTASSEEEALDRLEALQTLTLSKAEVTHLRESARQHELFFNSDRLQSSMNTLLRKYGLQALRRPDEYHFGSDDNDLPF